MSTLRLVAAAARVHVATASAVLNAAKGNTRVSAETRERVLAAARKLSYVPNESARSLRTGRSRIVGFLGGDLRNPFFAELAAALESELMQRGLQLAVSHVALADPLQVEKAMENFRQQSAKKIINWVESDQSPRSGKPAGGMTLSVGFTNRERPGVWLDLRYAIACAVEELRRRGFRKLGFFSPKSQGESPSAAARSATFAAVCKRKALPPPVRAFYAGESWDLQAAVQGAAQALKEHSEVEAWLGFNDIAALGLLRGLPKKAASRVLCFDGTSLARCWPGPPGCLDLKLPDFAKAIASVVSDEQSADFFGKKDHWLRPGLLL